MLPANKSLRCKYLSVCMCWFLAPHALRHEVKAGFSHEVFLSMLSLDASPCCNPILMCACLLSRSFISYIVATHSLIRLFFIYDLWMNSWQLNLMEIEEWGQGPNRFCRCVFLFDSPQCFLEQNTRPSIFAWGCCTHGIRYVVMFSGCHRRVFDIRCSSSLGNSNAPWKYVAFVGASWRFKRRAMDCYSHRIFPAALFCPAMCGCLKRKGQNGQKPGDAVRSKTDRYQLWVWQNAVIRRVTYTGVLARSLGLPGLGKMNAMLMRGERIKMQDALV